MERTIEMTTITKEQVEDALKGLWITSESCNSDEHYETLHTYISQLEANQRQPVSESPQSGLRSNPQNVDSEKLPDEVENAIHELELSYPETGGHNILGGEHYANKIRTRIAALAKELEATKQTAAGHYLTWQCTEAGLREQIAALEAGNKRLRDGIEKARKFIQGGLITGTAFSKHIQLEDSAKILDALAQPGVSQNQPEVSDKAVCGYQVSDKHPEPQKCGTCGGRGWEYSPLENTKVDCPVCDGTGKAGA